MPTTRGRIKKNNNLLLFITLAPFLFFFSVRKAVNLRNINLNFLQLITKRMYHQTRIINRWEWHLRGEDWLGDFTTSLYTD